jgi:hypothetical protein
MKSMQVANGLSMRMEAVDGRWVLKIDPTVIETKKDATMAAKNIKAFARMLPDSLPRERKRKRPAAPKLVPRARRKAAGNEATPSTDD